MPDPSKKTSRANPFIAAAVLVALLITLWWMRRHLGYDWRILAKQLQSLSVLHITEALASIYGCYWLRAVRWKILLGPLSKTTSLELLPSQVIGFTAVALFGRFADLARPYLVARRLRAAVTTQLAIYSIERTFDLAAAAILFSATLALAPHDMPHHETFVRAGAISLGATIILAAFAIALRMAGDRVACFIAMLVHRVSPTMAETIADRIREFSKGLQIIASFSEFAYALLLSLLMWAGIACAYLESARAFRAEPTLAAFSLPATMLLMATAMGGSLLQIPIVGWFTQTALIAGALHVFVGVPLAAASAAGAVMFAVTNLAIIPAGLIAAKMQGIGLRDVAKSTPTEVEKLGVSSSR